MQEQGEGGEILFAAALCDSLAGSIPEAVAEPACADALRAGNSRFSLLRIVRQRQMHETLSR